MSKLLTANEVHVYLDQISILEANNSADGPMIQIFTTLDETMDAFNWINALNGQIHTTILRFLSFRYAKRLFVHVLGVPHEITPEMCAKAKVENNPRVTSHTIENLLMSGSFEWFGGVDGYCKDLEGEKND